MTDAEYAAQVRALLGPDASADERSAVERETRPPGFVERGGAGPGSVDPDGPATELPKVGMDRFRAHPKAMTDTERKAALDRGATASHTDDPGVQAIVGGVMGAGAARAAAPVLEAALAPAGARTASGVVSGAAGSVAAGGDARTGAELGGALGAAGAAGDALAARAARQEVNATYRAFGRAGNTTSQEKLEAIGPGPVQSTLKKYGVSGISEPGAARAGIRAARDKAGAELGAGYEAVAKVGGDIEMGPVVKAIDELQARWGKTTGTQPFAEDAANLRTKLLKTYGDKGSISAADLNAEIGAIENGAYAGNYSNPGTAKLVKRVTAKSLDNVLQQHLDDIAKKPGGSEAVANLREVNQDYRVLSTLAPIAQKQAVKQTFAETGAEEFKRDPAGAMKKAAAAVAAAPMRAAGAAVRGVGSAASSVGAVPPSIAAPAVAAIRNQDREGATRELVNALGLQ